MAGDRYGRRPVKGCADNNRSVSSVWRLSTGTKGKSTVLNERSVVELKTALTEEWDDLAEATSRPFRKRKGLYREWVIQMLTAKLQNIEATEWQWMDEGDEKMRGKREEKMQPKGNNDWEVKLALGYFSGS